MNSEDKARLRTLLAGEGRLLAGVRRSFPQLQSVPLTGAGGGWEGPAEMLRQDCASHGYELYGQLGSGAFGQVWLAYVSVAKLTASVRCLSASSKVGSRLCAVKVSSRASFKSSPVYREVVALRRVEGHPSVCCLRDVFRAGSERLCMVLELCAGGSLELYVAQCACRTPAGGLPESDARRLFDQLAKALLFCHSRGVAHRDLTCKNVMLDAKNNAKLVDFGMAIMHHPQTGFYTSQFGGTPSYRSPEILCRRRHCARLSDMWSLGVVLFRMLTHQFPFRCKDTCRAVQKMRAHSYNDVINVVTAEVREVLQHMLQYDPRQRLTFDELRASDWMMGVVSRRRRLDTASPVTACDATAAAASPAATASDVLAAALLLSASLNPAAHSTTPVSRVAPPTVAAESSDELTSGDIGAAVTHSVSPVTSPVNLLLTVPAHSLQTANGLQQAPKSGVGEAGGSAPHLVVTNSHAAVSRDSDSSRAVTASRHSSVSVRSLPLASSTSAAARKRDGQWARLHMLPVEQQQQKVTEPCTSLPMATAAVLHQSSSSKMATSSSVDIISTTTSVEALQQQALARSCDVASTSTNTSTSAPVFHPSLSPQPSSSSALSPSLGDDLLLPGLLTRRWTYSKNLEQQLEQKASVISPAAVDAQQPVHMHSHSHLVQTAVSSPPATAQQLQPQQEVRAHSVHVTSQSSERVHTPQSSPVHVHSQQAPVHVHSQPAPVHVHSQQPPAHASRQYNHASATSLQSQSLSKMTSLPKVQTSSSLSLSNQVPFLLKAASIVPESRPPSTLRISSSYVKQQQRQQQHTSGGSGGGNELINTVSASIPTLLQLGAGIAATSVTSSSTSVTPGVTAVADGAAWPTVAVRLAEVHSSKSNSKDADDNRSAFKQEGTGPLKSSVGEITMTTKVDTSSNNRTGRPRRPPARAGFCSGSQMSAAGAVANDVMNANVSTHTATVTSEAVGAQKVSTDAAMCRWAQPAAVATPPIIRRPISNSNVAVVRPSAIIRLLDNRSNSSATKCSDSVASDSSTDQHWSDSWKPPSIVPLTLERTAVARSTTKGRPKTVSFAAVASQRVLPSSASGQRQMPIDGVVQLARISCAAAGDKKRSLHTTGTSCTNTDTSSRHAHHHQPQALSHR